MYILSAVVFLCPWTRESANPALTLVLSVTRTQVHQHNPSLKSTNLLLLTECHIGIQQHCKISTTHSTISEYVLHCNSSTCQTSDFSADGVLLSAYFVTFQLGFLTTQNIRILKQLLMIRAEPLGFGYKWGFLDTTKFAISPEEYIFCRSTSQL